MPPDYATAYKDFEIVLFKLIYFRRPERKFQDKFQALDQLVHYLLFLNVPWKHLFVTGKISKFVTLDIIGNLHLQNEH